MSVNKNALLRYQVLDRCFRNTGRNFFWKDLLHEINKALTEFNGEGSCIKRRQLFDDIKFMESEQGWSIPLERINIGKKVHYRYSDPRFSISSQPLTELEKGQIDAAVSVLSRFSGTPQFEWVQEIIPVLKDRLGLKKDSTMEVISLESNIDLKGIDYLSPLYEAIINERVLNISYKDFRSENAFDIIFHPYYLKEYNNRWFVFGLNEELGVETWNLALDRVHEIGQTHGIYKRTHINWNDYFYDIVGVTRHTEMPVEKVTLHFSENIAPYIITKPLHPTQKSKWIGKFLQVTIEVIPNYELSSMILSFGDHIEVVEPETLKNDIRVRLQKAIENYT